MLKKAYYTYIRRAKVQLNIETAITRIHSKRQEGNYLRYFNIKEAYFTS